MADSFHNTIRTSSDYLRMKASVIGELWQPIEFLRPVGDVHPSLVLLIWL